MNDEKKINVQVSKSTHERLTRVGRKNETYNEIIERVLNYYESSH